MKRIRIAGPPGSGKTYLAPKLSELFNIPWYELDNEICFAPDDVNFTKKLSDKERQRRLKKLVDQEKWIFEGCYTSPWVETSYSRADVVVLIVPSRFLRTWRVVKRKILRHITRKKTEKFSKFLKFVWETWSFERKITRIKSYNKNILHFKSADAAYEHFKKLRA